MVVLQQKTPLVRRRQFLPMVMMMPMTVVMPMVMQDRGGGWLVQKQPAMMKMVRHRRQDTNQCSDYEDEHH